MHEPPKEAAAHAFETGDWDWDPKKDQDWDNPSIERLVLRDEDLPAVADAIVRGASLASCIVPDLKALIDAVQAHPEARLARATEPDEDGFIRPACVWQGSGANAKKVDQPATELTLYGCVVRRCIGFADCEVCCTLAAQSRFVGVAPFHGACFAGVASFDRARFADAASFGGARFAGKAWFAGACFAGKAWFAGACFARGGVVRLGPLRRGGAVRAARRAGGVCAVFS